jgi:hypothetical protein
MEKQNVISEDRKSGLLYKTLSASGENINYYANGKVVSVEMLKIVLRKNML